jgi:hypothetical protein
MTPTSIKFIDELRQEWSAGAISRDEALERLLLWEDDSASRTSQELEAAWTLRQEIDSGATEISTPLEESRLDTTPPSQVEQPTQEATGLSATTLEQMLADLRANPLLGRDDLVAAHALCARLATAETGIVSGDEEYVRTRCSEVSQKVDLHIEAVQHLVEEASHAIQDAPDIADKLHACDRIREALTDMEMLRPREPNLPDMITWCEQTGQELRTLLAGRDLLLADVAGICALEDVDVGLVESSKQRLIVMSDMPFAKDDVHLRKAARELTAKLSAYLSSRLQPGAEGITVSEEALERYERVLRLAKQAPEAMSADEAKTYADLLTAARPEAATTKQGSEPPARNLPATPPPQPRSTTGSQPNLSANPDTGSLHPPVQPTQPLGPSQPAFSGTRPLPPPPMPRGFSGPGGTQPTQPINPPHSSTPQQVSGLAPGQGGTIAPTQPRNTVSVPQQQYTQPGYSPASTGQGVPPAAWAAIVVGVVAIIVIGVVVLLIATGSKGGSSGGGASPRDTVSSYYDNLRAHNYQAAHNLLAPELANQVSADDLSATITRNEAAAGPMQPVTVPNISDNGNTAQTVVTVKYADGQQTVDTVSLRKVTNRWLITSVN